MGAHVQCVYACAVCVRARVHVAGGWVAGLAFGDALVSEPNAMAYIVMAYIVMACLGF